MTYPPVSPGQPTAPGYPAPQSYPPAPAGPSRVPVYLSAAVAALGLAAYLASFGPLLTIKSDIGPFGGAQFTASGLSYWTVAALVGALLAAVGLLPKAPKYPAVVAVASVLGVLLVIASLINRPEGFSVGWALWLVLLFTVFQSVAAVTALLFETGALTAPAPRPRYEPYAQYGPPPANYYPGVPGAAQRPGYPPQYGAYPPGGFGQQDAASGPPTPPAGFPSQSAPPAEPSHQPPAAEPAPNPGSGSTQP